MQNKIFKIISSLMILLTILSVVNATTISNSLSTFTSIIDMGTQQIYNITNVNTTNIYASTVNTTNLWIGSTKVNASNLLPLACANNSVGKYDTATGTWLCQTDQTGGTDTNDNVTSIQFTGTTTKTLTLEQSGSNTNKTATFTDTDTDTWYNVTSVQVTGTGTKTLNVEQLGGIANRTASWTDIDTTLWTNSSNNAVYTAGNVGIGASSPGGKLDIANTVQASERIRLSGQEFYAGSTTDTNGVSVLLGVNRNNNRQLWLADSANLAVNTTNPTIWFYLPGKANAYSAIGSRATDGSTNLPLGLQINGGNLGVGTSSPSEKLVVTGNINMTGDIITNLGQGIKLNQSQSYVNIIQNSSGCTVIKGASSTLAVC